MIRLFRKIRHKLLSENNYGIYILYATGEIVLVMVGILLAFQIDNWNDLKKEAEFERKVLNELNVSLQRNISHLNRGLGNNEAAIASCNIILNHFKEGLTYNDTLDHHFSISLQWYYPTLTSNAYESLKTYGLHLIKNELIHLAYLSYIIPSLMFPPG